MGSDGRSASPEPSVDRTALRSTLEEYPLRLAILFGSRVEGRQHPQSDVDVGVLFEEDCTGAERRERYLDLHSTLPVALDTDDVDVTLLDDVPASVGRQALQSYEVLVGDPAVAERLREQYEAAAPRPSRDDLLARLDERIAQLDAALDGDEA